MLTLNLATLGVTEEALERSILNELGMTKEQAVRALAEKFGVTIPAAVAPVGAVKTGDTVQTDQGEAKAKVLSEAEVRTIAEAGTIMERLFA